MVRKVAIYCRVSTLDQTVDNQLIELRDHCSKIRWEITKEYSDEVLSGTLSRDKRPALNSLIKDAYRKRFDAVVCWDISRIGRSMKELVLFLSDMKDRDIGIVSVHIRAPCIHPIQFECITDYSADQSCIFELNGEIDL